MSVYFAQNLTVEAARIRFGHSWMASRGEPCAAIEYGAESAHGSITLHSVEEAEALIKAATEARDALAGLIASAPPATPEERAEYEAWRAARAEAAGSPAKDGA